MNRCAECRKFCKWEELTCTDYIPLHETGYGDVPESMEYTCDKCLEKAK